MDASMQGDRISFPSLWGEIDVAMAVVTGFLSSLHYLCWGLHLQCQRPSFPAW